MKNGTAFAITENALFKAADTIFSPVPEFDDEPKRKTAWPNATTRIADDHEAPIRLASEPPEARWEAEPEPSYSRDESDPGCWGGPVNLDQAELALQASIQAAIDRDRQAEFDNDGIARARREAAIAEEAARREAMDAAETMALEALLAAEASIVDIMLTTPVQDDRRPPPISGEFRAVQQTTPVLDDEEPSVRLPPGAFAAGTPQPELSSPNFSAMPNAYAPGMQPMPQPPRRLPMDSTPPDDAPQFLDEAANARAQQQATWQAQQQWQVPPTPPQGKRAKRESFPVGLPQTLMTIPPQGQAANDRQPISDESMDCRPQGLFRWISKKAKMSGR